MRTAKVAQKGSLREFTAWLFGFHVRPKGSRGIIRKSIGKKRIGKKRIGIFGMFELLAICCMTLGVSVVLVCFFLAFMYAITAAMKDYDDF